MWSEVMVEQLESVSNLSRLSEIDIETYYRRHLLQVSSAIGLVDLVLLFATLGPAAARPSSLSLRWRVFRSRLYARNLCQRLIDSLHKGLHIHHALRAKVRLNGHTLRLLEPLAADLQISGISHGGCVGQQQRAEAKGDLVAGEQLVTDGLYLGAVVADGEGVVGVGDVLAEVLESVEGVAILPGFGAGEEGRGGHDDGCGGGGGGGVNVVRC